MSIYDIVLYLCVLISGGSAFSIIFIKSIFRAALALLICLLSIAAIYVLLSAEFLAVAQILIYAGGVIVLLIFGIMLTARMSNVPLVVATTNRWLGTATGLFIAYTLALQYLKSNFIFSINQTPETVTATGINILTLYLLPFEITGILLLVTLIGAVVVSSQTSNQ